MSQSLLRTTSYLLALLFAAVLTAGCAGTQRSASTGEYIDDTVITTKIKADIFNDATLSAAEINVETFKGRVQLSGFVSNQTDMNRAVAMARAVNGVTSVSNDMKLK